MPPVDTLERDGERLVLVPGRAVRVLGIAPTVLDLVVDWVALPDLVAEVEDVLGPGPSGQATELVRAAVEQLALEGLVETDPA